MSPTQAARAYGTAGVSGKAKRGAQWDGRHAQFWAVVTQFALVILVANYWHIETEAVGYVLQLAFVGFIIHHFLPMRLRLPFFALLSLIITIVVVDRLGPATWAVALKGTLSLKAFFYQLFPGLVLIAIGLGLIGVCHLPIRFGARVSILIAAGVAFAVLRSHTEWLPDVSAIWVVLGSMFVFRLMIYLYDVKHQLAVFSPARAVSYFFMLPNVCFPLFPVVDYKTFCATYYNEDWPRGYQTGLKWMVRGIFHLLLYRVVYQFAPLDASKLSSSLDVAGFMLGTYLLYLRISGSFHLIVGLLHMFGFNLPETHHLYLLASSFSDFWRRINIYWKDFVMKLFFYPAYFAWRRLGALRAIALATVATFFATWLLHSWQWFWIRGTILFTWQDIVFWGTLAVLVLVNGLYEASAGKRLALSPSRVTIRRRLILGLKTAATFIVICTLWTVWSAESWSELRGLADAASNPTLGELAIIAAGLLLIAISGMLWGRSGRETSQDPLPVSAVPFRFWHSAAGITAGAVCLLTAPSIALWAVGVPRGFATRLRSDGLNARDMDVQRRGYYEELDSARADNWHMRAEKMPKNWTEKDVWYRKRQDFLLLDVTPSTSAALGGTRASSNQFGMRDREYNQAKPIGTYRMVLMGSSHDQGTGVKDDETYENRVEDRLNHELPNPNYSRYEILNLSVGGDSILQKLLRLEQTGFGFEPDAVLFSVAAMDRYFVAEHLRKCLTRRIDPPPGYRGFLGEIVRKAGVTGKMLDVMIERRIDAYVPEVYQWTFRRMKGQCEQRKIRPLIVFRPEPVSFKGTEASRGREIAAAARSIGLELLDLSSAFQSVSDSNQLITAKWDEHTNALGHQLLAEKLYEKLLPLLRAEKIQR